MRVRWALIDSALVLWFGSIIAIGSVLQVRLGETIWSNTTLICLVGSLSTCCIVSERYKNNSKVVDFINFMFVRYFQPRTRWNHLIVGGLGLIMTLVLVLSAMG